MNAFVLTTLLAIFTCYLQGAVSEEDSCVDANKLKEMLEGKKDKCQEIFDKIKEECKKEADTLETRMKCVKDKTAEKLTPDVVKEGIDSEVSSPTKKEQLKELIDNCGKGEKEKYFDCYQDGVAKICPEIGTIMHFYKTELIKELS